jgi:predicted PurR-regulated permease PerM
VTSRTISLRPTGPPESGPGLDGQPDSEIISSLLGIGHSAAVSAIGLLAALYTFYFAASLLMPIAVAVLLSMLLSPAVDYIEKVRAPRMLASAIVVIATIGMLGAGIVAVAGPAQSWIEKGPDSLHKIEHMLVALKGPLDAIKQTTDQLQEVTKPGGAVGPQDVRVVQPAFTDLVLSGTPQVAASIISVIILVYLLLASGDVFLRKLVTVIPTFHDKKRIVEITRQIETDISFYLLNFTLINVGLGVAAAALTFVLGIPNPLLWGVMVTALNFVPYVGALTSIAVLTMAGVQSFDNLPQALAAPAIMLVLVAISAEVITPIVLGRGLQLNPVAIFIAILLWGWLWGLVGVLLAVPLLASFKIVCERVKPLHPIAEFLTS